MDITNVQSVSYSYTGMNPLLKGHVDPASGQDALIPSAGVDNFSQLQAYYQQITSTNPITRESANVVVLNASDIVGLASTKGDMLTSKGYSVMSVASASAKYSSTIIVDMSDGKMPATLAGLKQLFPGNVVSVTDKSAETKEALNYTSADFVVILGKNWDSSANSTN
jgi:hypothetical protein